MLNRRVFWFLLSLISLAACGPKPARAPALGEGFVGPATLNLRQEISLRSKVVAVVKHGQKLEIIQRHRRFLKVRTPQGAEGWTDSRQLMSPAQMTELRRLAERSAALPSQGRAAAFGPLNIHTEPNRQSPSFCQIAEGEAVEVIGQRLAPRGAPPTPSPAPERKREPPSSKPGRPKRETPARVPPPPMPAPPGPPPNWLELSPSPAGLAGKSGPEPLQPPVSSGPLEDWSLVRTRQDQAGWVLTRMLRMAIPDEVAQYAEGHRITSYFSLGEVIDGGQTKHFWLWTTISKDGQPHQFDSFRVFVWSMRRHRYETAYIERNVTGYFPVEVRTAETPPRRAATRPPGFSVIVEGKDGALQRRSYAFRGYRVVLVERTPWKLPAGDAGGAPEARAKSDRDASEQPSWFQRLKAAVAQWWKR